MSTLAGDTPVFELGPDDPGRGVGLRPGVRLERVSPVRRMEAAIRLVGDQTDDPYSAARRFLESAEPLNIDLSLMWATESTESGSPSAIRQVALVVPGSGRTAMVFVSGPARRRRGGPGSIAELGSGPIPTAERVAAIRAGCAFVAKTPLAATFPHGATKARACALAQSLLETRELDALVAFRAAGFTQVGDLAYMRRTAGAPPAGPATPRARPEAPGLVDVRIASVASMQVSGAGASRIDQDLLRALDRSYIGTADCPELCGLRSTEDVLASHRAVGRYDPALWWIVYRGDEPEGCLLFSVCPEQESVELVYLGLSPALRGLGLGAHLLRNGLRVIHGAVRADAAVPAVPGFEPVGPPRCLVGPGGVTCAVDTRNDQAMRLYRASGFQRFAVRVPVVLRLS